MRYAKAALLTGLLKLDRWDRFGVVAFDHDQHWWTGEGVWGLFVCHTASLYCHALPHGSPWFFASAVSPSLCSLQLCLTQSTPSMHVAFDQHWWTGERVQCFEFITVFDAWSCKLSYTGAPGSYASAVSPPLCSVQLGCDDRARSAALQSSPSLHAVDDHHARQYNTHHSFFSNPSQHSAQAALANTLFHMKVRRSELLELPWV
jgi:hypothetical protein